MSVGLASTAGAAGNGATVVRDSSCYEAVGADGNSYLYCDTYQYQFNSKLTSANVGNYHLSGRDTYTVTNLTTGETAVARTHYSDKYQFQDGTTTVESHHYSSTTTTDDIRTCVDSDYHFSNGEVQYDTTGTGC
jgi:hypothetical protein